jgi:type VI secretion system Hcp family effector
MGEVLTGRLRLRWVGPLGVIGLDGGLTVATSSSTGLPTGRVSCDGINFRKPTDRSTPALFAAAARGETISNATFNEYQLFSSGVRTLALQTKLKNVFISSLHHVNATTTGAYDDVTPVPAVVTLTWKPTNKTSQVSCHSAT